MSTLVRVTFDASTPLPPLVTRGATAAEDVTRYLGRAYSAPLFVDVTGSLGVAFDGGQLLAAFNVIPLGGAA
ncbi:hypothetical protein ACF09L_32885 [Streptomyces sp. NPDC014779]|uniref:hypothetical protein n=1 Tax=Streptomyces sp. NPDC014779 TaxID=3364911 RepID=UPI0036FC5A34